MDGTRVLPASNLRPTSHTARRGKRARAFVLMQTAAAVGLSLLFFLIYGGCLAITATRSDIGACHFAWERHLPFVPWMIFPYLSIDLFFFASFFLAKSRGELRTLWMRLALATLIAGACFLLVPLRYAFETPLVEGWLGSLIHWFKAADRPYNLAPSLHIAIRSILWVIYVRHTRGILRGALQAWFILIGLSTILVYQHHLIDVLTGQFLAMLCIVLVREPGIRPARSQPRRDLAAWYAIASATSVAVALLIGNWAWLMLWPAVSLALLAQAYRLGDCDAFRKRNGRLPLSSRVVHAPLILLQRLMLLLQFRRRPAWSPIAPHVWIGQCPSRSQLAALHRAGMRTILDLTAELSCDHLAPDIHRIHVPLLDLTLPGPDLLRRLAELIEERLVTGGVYIHCALGLGRSAIVAAAWLIITGRAADADDAVSLLRRARPGVVFGPAAVATLQAMELPARSLGCSY